MLLECEGIAGRPLSSYGNIALIYTQGAPGDKWNIIAIHMGLSSYRKIALIYSYKVLEIKRTFQLHFVTLKLNFQL